jgi:hypothetical protein
MYNFCTLFDSNYLPRALTMYHSLVKTGDDFTLYVVCFDTLAFEILSQLKLARLIAIRLEEFENKDLLSVKNTRSAGEYCWTCTPHVIHYVLDTYNLPQVTYLDADLYFYDRPSILLEELKESGASSLITEHRYTPIYDYSATSGIYCVQFMTFNADERGLEILQWWQDRCLEWCYNRHEEGKFGDQKYLDDWTTRFKGVHVLQHLGGGVAPWNIQQYKLSRIKNKLCVNEFPIIFYHFQEYKYYKNGIHDFVGGCVLSNDAVELLYRPYGLAILEAYKEIYTVQPEFNGGWATQDNSLIKKLYYLKRIIRGVANEYRIV